MCTGTQRGKYLTTFCSLYLQCYLTLTFILILIQSSELERQGELLAEKTADCENLIKQISVSESRLASLQGDVETLTTERDELATATEALCAREDELIEENNQASDDLEQRLKEISSLEVAFSSVEEERQQCILALSKAEEHMHLMEDEILRQNSIMEEQKNAFDDELHMKLTQKVN